MYALGIPIFNDRIYPPVYPTPDDDYSRPLQLLAKSISFRDPVTGEQRAFHTRLNLLAGFNAGIATPMKNALARRAFCGGGTITPQATSLAVIWYLKSSGA